MTDPIEDLLRRTLGDERRIVATPPAALLGVRRAERRLRLRRAVGVGSAGTVVLAAVAVALTSGGTAWRARSPHRHGP
ncbi:MAG: hypothetical protein LC779_14905 [Actinobacteria bacterium]|nr:hypothetical protein [Actinomycetota bacterium]